jgi:hypothetical protein
MVNALELKFLRVWQCIRENQTLAKISRFTVSCETFVECRSANYIGCQSLSTFVCLVLPRKWLNWKTNGTIRKYSRAFQWMVMSVGFNILDVFGNFWQKSTSVFLHHHHYSCYCILAQVLRVKKQNWSPLESLVKLPFLWITRKHAPLFKPIQSSWQVHSHTKESTGLASWWHKLIHLCTWEQGLWNFDWWVPCFIWFVWAFSAFHSWPDTFISYILT